MLVERLMIQDAKRKQYERGQAIMGFTILFSQGTGFVHVPGCHPQMGYVLQCQSLETVTLPCRPTKPSDLVGMVGGL